MEASASAISNTLLNTDSFIGVLVGVCIIGILTGFSEELFFRGGLLGIMDRTQMSKDLAVWSVAVIFSFLHFQFFGFFPRLLMGAFFGYLFIWSRNLWVPIFGHVLNNSLVVATAPFFMEFGSETTSEVSFGLNSEFPFLALASLTITILFFIFFRCYFFKTTSNKESLWQKNHLPPISGK